MHRHRIAFGRQTKQAYLSVSFYQASLHNFNGVLNFIPKPLLSTCDLFAMLPTILHGRLQICCDLLIIFGSSFLDFAAFLQATVDRQG
jgi:hypothetical protein